MLAADLAIKVNFKSGGKDGFLTDDGTAFAARNGEEYGWLCDTSPKVQTAGLRNWGNHFDRNNVCSGTTSWQIAVPNGEYDIKVLSRPGVFPKPSRHLPVPNMPRCRWSCLEKKRTGARCKA